MAIAVAAGGTLVDSSNVSAYTSGSFTPAAGELLLAFVSTTGSIIDATMTDTGQGMTWKQVSKVVYHSVAAPSDTVYLFVPNKLAAAVATTVIFDCTGDAATGAAIYVARLTNCNRLRQIKTNADASATTPAVTMDRAFDTNNCGLMAVANGANPPNLTLPTGWTATNGFNSGYTLPTAGMEVINRVSGETASTITCGAVSNQAWAAICVEAEIFGPRKKLIVPQSVNRAAVI